MVALRPYQRRFLAAVENPKYDTVALSGPRGLSKTFLGGRVLARCLTPGDPLHQPGKEYILGAASLEQARLTYAFVRDALEPTGAYRWIDSTTRLGATHVATNTKLRAISSNAKTSFGLVNVPIVVIDEPGALEIVGGEMLADSLFTAQGKPGSELKLILLGTLAPMATQAGHWWFDLVNGGTTGSVYVDHFRGDLETWDNWNTIRKANPLTAVSPEFRKKLLAERDAARADSRLKARFLSYRLNIPTADESTMLLTVGDWERVCKRPVTDPQGQPIFAVDLGGGRAWSTAVAMWAGGRVECLAVAPGIPDIAAQEKRDRQPSGTYAKLLETGRLRVADGLRVQPPGELLAAAYGEWGRPACIVADRFRVAELTDVADGVPVVERVTRWSEAAADIRATRKMAMDGPLNVAHSSRALLAASLSVAIVQNDSSGNFRLIKKTRDNSARDDVAAALVLGCGLMERNPPRAPAKVYRGLVPL